MNEHFRNVIGASDEDRRGLFLTAATRMGTAVQNVEKDFWVCWTLDAMFNGLAAGGPRLLFKGGTSLSKSFGLISRFSEDIDITVFREDLGQPMEAAQLEGLSGKQRRLRLEEIRQACEAYIMGAFQTQIADLARRAIPEGKFSVEPDPDDADHQTLLFGYPAVTGAAGDYIRAAVKIEAGAKSALDPHVQTSVQPFVSEDVPDLDLTVGNITTVSPERSFWDKVVILHGLRQWFEQRGVLRHEGQRVSRHYYDVHRMAQEAAARGWTQDQALAADCVTHARLFFGSPDLGLDSARAGSFTLTPTGAMREALAKDYQAMAGMIFGQAPELDAVLHSVQELESALNAPMAGEGSP